MSLLPPLHSVTTVTPVYINANKYAISELLPASVSKRGLVRSY